jgi:hypothetical protein
MLSFFKKTDKNEARRAEMQKDKAVHETAQKISATLPVIPVIDGEDFSSTEDISFSEWKEQNTKKSRTLNVPVRTLVEVCQEVGYTIQANQSDDLVFEVYPLVKDGFLIEEVYTGGYPPEILRTDAERRGGFYSSHAGDPRDTILRIAILRTAKKINFRLVRRKLPEETVTPPIPSWVDHQGINPYEYSVGTVTMWRSEAIKVVSAYLVALGA